MRRNYSYKNAFIKFLIKNKQTIHFHFEILKNTIYL
jgi:hypothetical protein